MPRGRRGSRWAVVPQHVPVMVKESVTALNIRPHGRYVDGTLGGGGHAEAILEAAEGTRLLGIDLDGDALDAATVRLSSYGDRVSLVRANFGDVRSIVHDHIGSLVDGIFLDLGLSSMQLDTGERGFSFRREAQLDMRFDSRQRATAHEVVNRYSVESLSDVIARLGEEPRARRIAREIVANRPIRTTTQLAEVVRRATGRPARGRIHPATRTFQAIRMEVNREMDNLTRGLEGAIEVLNAGGRLAVISYHSLEDRLVKQKLRAESSDCICPPGLPQCVCGHKASLRLVNRRVIRPSIDEVQANPRARSARMRVAERI
ncbi:MAG: 16S rRNA (cytosine(1402)-N(4))-methyltransferase RsmH [Chloroflexi bacterium]|nr:16S rRNA (cytosine(1402)-N(4))-methyltransferase RsmH [Chloroflexota bacterium]